MPPITAVSRRSMGVILKSISFKKCQKEWYVLHLQQHFFMVSLHDFSMGSLTGAIYETHRLCTTAEVSLGWWVPSNDPMGCAFTKCWWRWRTLSVKRNRLYQLYPCLSKFHFGFNRSGFTSIVINSWWPCLLWSQSCNLLMVGSSFTPYKTFLKVLSTHLSKVKFHEDWNGAMNWKISLKKAGKGNIWQVDYK